MKLFLSVSNSLGTSSRGEGGRLGKEEKRRERHRRIAHFHPMLPLYEASPLRGKEKKKEEPEKEEGERGGEKSPASDLPLLY